MMILLSGVQSFISGTNMNKIEYEGKAYVFTQDRLTAKLFITVDKKKVFAGYGEGNMNKGFKLVEDVKPSP